MNQRKISLTDVFSRISGGMQEEFQGIREAVSHSTLKGTGNEEIVQRFLSEHFPTSIGVTAGEIVDSVGGRTRQMDVVLTDAGRTPVLHQIGKTQVIPVESVIAVIEVKSNLRASDLGGVLRNMASAKQLTKIAYYRETGPIVNTVHLFGQEFDHFPTIYGVFAFESDDLGTIAQALNQLQEREPVHRRIDLVCSLERGVVLNQDRDGMYAGTPNNGTHMVGYDTANALLLFFLLLAHPVLQAEQPPVNLLAYVDGNL